MPGKKDYVSICRNVHNVQCIRTVQCIQRQISQHKNQIFQVLHSKTKWCVLAGSSGTHSVCVCSTHQNAVLLVDTIDWDYIYKDLMKKVVCDPDNKLCMMHRMSHIREVLLWKSSWMMISVIWIWTLNTIVVSGKQQTVLLWLHLKRNSKNTRNSSSTAWTTLLDTRTWQKPKQDKWN